MASGYLSAELTATCNALGYYDGQTYHLEPHCAETAKDLIRYLRRDDDSHEIRRFFGNTKIVQTDLLPIIQCHPDNQELFDVVLRLLVNLTNPAFLVYKESIPKDKAVRNQYLDLVSHLQASKEAFTQHKPWDVIAEKLSLFLNTEEHLRDDDMRRNIERILILVRNVLHVADSDGEARPDNDASVHDQVLWALHQSGMLDLILYIASSPQEQCFYMHILEVICLMVREQPAVLLGQAASTRSNEEKDRDSDELLAIRKRESIANQQKMRKYQGMRNFGGTYVIKNMKSTSEKDIIYHKPIQSFSKISLDLEKKKIRIPKNRQPLQCFNVERRSALSVRLILKQFCIEILNAAYNPLMKTVKDSLVRGKTQDNDESYYFNAMTFFMEFNRSYKYQVKLVSETLSVESFRFVHKYLEMWHEMMVTDKGKIHLWSTRLHFALKAYKELLYNLAEMDKNEDEGVRESSRVIKSNIFYAIEYREMLLVLMKSYKKPKHSMKYLCDLMETVHIFLKILEVFAKNKKMFVQKKVKPRKKNNKKSVKQNQKANLEDVWITLSSQLATAIESPVNKDVFPFDAASDIPMDEQKIIAVKKIQNLLKSGDFEEAIAFLRASREVWPENDTFGSQDCSPEDELVCFKEVFLADLDTGFPGEDVDNDAPLSEEEEDSYPSTVEEINFDVSEFLKSFADPRVVYICGLLLRSFEVNSKSVNHCIAKMFHRIAWDCKVPSMIFQASIFRSFQRILASHNPSHKELAMLAKFIVRKFVEVSANNKKLLMELLFWKSSKDAYDIEVGYGSYQEKSKSAKLVWEEHEEDELRRLYMEYKETHPDEELTSDNVVPWITTNLIKDRSEKSVAKKLKELFLVVGKAKAKKKPLWSPDDEEKLKSLFEEFRGSDDPVGQIMERMPDRSRRTINSTLLKLNVVYDRSELKPKKNSRRRNSHNDERRHDDTDDSSSSSSSSSSDEDESRVNLDEEKIKQRRALDRPRLTKSIHELINFSSARLYLVDGVEWLHESMKDNVEDCEDDPTEVPLLPLSESAIKSVDDKLFQNLLLSIGLFSPFQQQEMYWRFPSTWNSEEYAKRIDLITMVIQHCKDDAHQLSTDLKDFITNKFGERIPSSFEDQDASDEDLNTTSKDDFDSLVAQQCKETLEDYSASVKDPFDNLLYSKSDDESHKETANGISKKSKKKSKNTKINSSDDDSDIESNKLSKNPFMSKIKELAKNKMNLNKFVKDDHKETHSKIKNKFNSDSESDKENDTNNELRIEDSRNSSPLQKSANKTKKNRILLNSDESDSESSNLNDITSKNKIVDYDDKKDKDSPYSTPSGKSSKKLVDSDDSDTESNINTNKLSSSSVKPKRSRLISDSEESGDEDKMESTGNNDDNDENSVKSMEQSQDSQVNSVHKRPRISLDSDEEMEESQSNSVTNKKRHIIESDED